MRFFFASPQSNSLSQKDAPLQASLVAALVAILVLAFSLSAPPALANATKIEGENPPSSTASVDMDANSDVAPAPVLDVATLLDQLANSEDSYLADDLAGQIQSHWNDSGSESVNLLMRRASLAMRTGNFPLALDLLDTAIALAPDYAEVWNRRATVHFLRDDYALSIADVQQVLRLEPRHFGALSGIGIMLDELGEDAQAQLFLQEALRVHPHLSDARQRLQVIDQRLRGAPI